MVYQSEGHWTGCTHLGIYVKDLMKTDKTSFLWWKFYLMPNLGACLWISSICSAAIGHAGRDEAQGCETETRLELRGNSWTPHKNSRDTWRLFVCCVFQRLVEKKRVLAIHFSEGRKAAGQTYSWGHKQAESSNTSDISSGKVLFQKIHFKDPPVEIAANQCTNGKLLNLQGSSKLQDLEYFHFMLLYISLPQLTIGYFWVHYVYLTFCRSRL